ncbi:GGDEF domain-containing protein [Photobacterium sp. SDRW27]|uniref:GGDEF domain-containing protein n=1 Tax=Photobacterium obscurum TaxID=2829490 RepID=UPI002244C314|nr:GGDEF domain-containing protein [Photobacterium obscurum]MCW8329701.1 GGDEF domain-containing protein [Photobacterium obscurum]
MTKLAKGMQDNQEHLLKTLKLYIPDLWSAKAHTASFQNTRSGYLRNRISMLSIVWGILIILWVPFDLYYLPAHQDSSIVIARVLLGAALFFIARINNQQTSLRHAQWCMSLMVIGLNLFYLYSMHQLDYPIVYSGFEYGYTLLPILHVAILTILPVTLKESLGLLAITAGTQLFVDFQAQRLFTPENLADYWLQNVLAVMVIWSQLSKLSMLMRLYRQATLDPLTGIYNRRMLLQLAQKSLISCDIKGAPFSVLLFDIDKFKRINDTWGHGAGDKVLRGFTDFMQSQIRKTDLFGRYGGEEFILFLPRCNADMAETIADRMLNHIRRLELPIGFNETRLKITTCIGIASFLQGDTLSSMIERADRALYECKDSGRDCSRFHPVGYQYQGNERRKALA